MSMIENPNDYLDEGIDDAARWERIRKWRNRYLLASDFRMVSDTPFDKGAWGQYRQQLRDLPLTVSDPAKIVFPEPPTV